MDEVEPRLAEIRGRTPARNHNARTIAALTSNPGCARRAVMDAAGVDKPALAAHLGFPARFGQSGFAIARGNAFEARVKADGCAELLRLLRERLGLPVRAAGHTDLGAAGSTPGQRYARTRDLIDQVASGTRDSTLFDHPMLRLAVGGRPVYLEPDLVAVHAGGRFHVVEIKSFAVVDGRADRSKVDAAATQAAAYVLALRDLLDECGHPRDMVAHDAILVCPEDFSNRPTATRLDVRTRLAVLARQLRRLHRLPELLATVPPGLTLDLDPDAHGVPRRPVGELDGAVRAIEARYVPECLASCEMAYFCRHEGRGGTAGLGRTVQEDLGGLPDVATVLDLAEGRLEPPAEQAEAARMLRQAHRLYAEPLVRAR